MRHLRTFILALVALFAAQTTHAAEGWPKNYGGVMLQSFYWDSFYDTKWTNLEKDIYNMQNVFDLVWLPQSANCGNQSMGYDVLHWFTNYNSAFGTETELRKLIKAMSNAQIGAIADVVINHRKNVSNWVDFPRETWNGKTYELKSTDICGNDDNGKTQKWASQNGYTLGGNDTGEGWDGMRDLDHNSSNVQENVKEIGRASCRERV